MFPAVLLLAAVPAAVFGFVDGYAALIVVGFFLGIAGASFAVGVPFVAGWYGRERQGFALGVYGMGNIGTAVAAFGAPAIVDLLGREALGIVAAALLVATAFVFHRYAVEPPRGPAVRYTEVLRSGWRLWRLALLYFVTFGGFVAMAVFLPKLLQDWFDLSRTDAGLRAAGFTVLATLARPVGGMLSDRVGAATVLAVVFLLVGVDAAALAVISGDPTIVPVTIACLTLAAFLGLGNGAVFKAVPAGVPGRDPAPRRASSAPPEASAGSSRRSSMGLVKDHFEGTYALGFVGLARRLTCLCLVVGAAACAPPAATPRRCASRDACSTRPRVLRAPAARPTGWSVLQRGRPRMGALLPRALAARPGRALDARRQLHRVVLLEDLRQGRDRRLGDPADRLPVERARTCPSTSRAAARAARRSAGTSTRRSACGTRTCAACCSSSTARRARGTRRPRRGLGVDRRGSRDRRARYKSQRGKGGFVRASLGRGRRARSPPRTSTPSSATAPTASPASRRSRRCRWSPTRPGRGSSR